MAGGNEGGQPGRLGWDLTTEELDVLLRTQAFPRGISGILKEMSLMSKTLSMSGPWQYALGATPYPVTKSASCENYCWGER